MKRDNLAVHLGIAFAIALAVYFVAYRGIEGRRTRHGPWELTFTNTPEGHPKLLVEQPRLGLTNIAIHFVDEMISTNSVSTNFPARLRFDVPRLVPFPLPF